MHLPGYLYVYMSFVSLVLTPCDDYVFHPSNSALNKIEHMCIYILSVACVMLIVLDLFHMFNLICMTMG